MERMCIGLPQALQLEFSNYRTKETDKKIKKTKRSTNSTTGKNRKTIALWQSEINTEKGKSKKYVVQKIHKVHRVILNE